MYFANDEAREKLLTALTDGSHEQVHGKLMGYLDVGKIGHCCLGVAADISGCGKFDKTSGYWFDDVDENPETMVNHQSSNYLTQNVAKWLDLKWDDNDHEGTRNFKLSNPGFKVLDCEGRQLFTQPTHFDLEGNPVSETKPIAPGLANLNDAGFTFAQIADCIRYFMSGPAKVDDDVHAE